MQASVTLQSSDETLVAGFAWAKTQALAYVFQADPVGDWFEAALPGREAFCMRDVAHQSTGAQVLGLAAATRNMLRKFAENIAETRDWCSYWEINRHNKPAPVDYCTNSDFWYNLPANFDVLHCCYRQHLWTGDRTYLDDPVFRNFYDRTVNDYVRAWDKDGDGIPEHYPVYGTRGIATYNEEVRHPLIGGDLIAVQAAAYLAYAAILELTGTVPAAGGWRVKAQGLRELYGSRWWNAALRRFASFQLQDRSYSAAYHGMSNYFPLYFGLVADEERLTAVLDDEIARRTALCIEERSYLPELFYAYGREDAAYAELTAQMAPTYSRREYPEVSYAIVGTIATGMLGLAPDATTSTLKTRPRLVAQTDWVEMTDLPILANRIQVRHTGQSETDLTNLSGPPFLWKATFPGHLDALWVDGAECQPQRGQDAHGHNESWVALSVGAQTSHTVTAR